MTDPGRADELEGALHRLFADAAPPPPEPAPVVLERIGPRMVWARRRRIAGQATTAAALTLGAVGIGLTVVPDQSETNTIAAVDGGGAASGSGTGATGSSPPVTHQSPPLSTSDSPSGGAPTSSTAIATTVVELATSTTSAPPPSSSAPTTTANTTTTIAVETTQLVFSSPGGSITVRWSTTEVALVSVDPEPGFTAQTTANGPTEVEVEFSNETTEDQHEIELELRDGELTRKLDTE